jgi:hypothetical protein
MLLYGYSYQRFSAQALLCWSVKERRIMDKKYPEYYQHLQTPMVNGAEALKALGQFEMVKTR